MLVTLEISERFEKVKEKGDVNRLTKILGFKSHSTTSLVISGKQKTTISRVSKFVKFIENREAKISMVCNPKPINVD